MKIKHAYNALLNSKSQGKYDRGFYGSEYSSYSNSTSGRNQSRTTKDDEEFYGFGIAFLLMEIIC